MPFGDKCQDLDLTSRELVQRTSNSECLVDGRREAVQIGLENEILRTGPYRLDAFGAGYRTRDDYEGCGWSQIAQYLLRYPGVESAVRVVRQDDVRLEIPDDGGERFFGVDTFGDCEEAGPVQLPPYRLSIRCGVLEHQNAYCFFTSHNRYISRWLTVTGRNSIALRHYLLFVEVLARQSQY